MFVGMFARLYWLERIEAAWRDVSPDLPVRYWRDRNGREVRVCTPSELPGAA